MSQYRWESGEKNSYIIAEDDTEPIDGSGTRIVLHLKEDSEEYLDDFKVGHSNFRWFLSVFYLLCCKLVRVKWETVKFVSSRWNVPTAGVH